MMVSKPPAGFTQTSEHVQSSRNRLEAGRQMASHIQILYLYEFYKSGIDEVVNIHYVKLNHLRGLSSKTEIKEVLKNLNLFLLHYK